MSLHFYVTLHFSFVALNILSCFCILIVSMIPWFGDILFCSYLFGVLKDRNEHLSPKIWEFFHLLFYAFYAFSLHFLSFHAMICRSGLSVMSQTSCMFCLHLLTFSLLNVLIHWLCFQILIFCLLYHLLYGWETFNCVFYLTY
jgi:hypothetical protein